VLVCDDHAILRKAVVSILEHAGFTVDEAPNTKYALARVGITHPDLVIMDVRVGDESGIEAVERIRSDPAIASTPVLLMSGELVGGNGGGVPGGADAFLVKPFDVPEFVQTVKDLVAG
jgi:CheY-like chemotaxis protein